MATRSVSLDELAVTGGVPVRGPDNPLPTSRPQAVASGAAGILNRLLESGLEYDTVDEFERAFAETMGASHAVAMSTCTDALHGVLAAGNVGPGDEVVASPITDYGSIKGVLDQGAKVVFADVDPLTGHITADDIRKVLSPRTKAIIAVHMYGLVCDMDPIVELARAHGLLLVEDVCQAPFAEYNGKNAGTIGDVGCFSLDSGKHLSTDGGAVAITDDQNLADRLRFLVIERGSRPTNRGSRLHEEFGHSFRYSRLQAAVALAGLPGLRDIVRRRHELAEQLSAQLRAIEGVSPPYVPRGRGHARWLYYADFDLAQFDASLDEIVDALNAEGLSCGPAMYYLIPHSHTFLPDREQALQQLPNARKHLEGIVRWPFTQAYSNGDIDDIAKMVAKVADAYRA